MAADPRFAELLRELHDHGVEFVVVGGVAAVLEGAPLSTFDLDIVPRWSPENLDRLALVLNDEFAAAMDDDLNTPQALAALFEAARAGNRALDAGVLPTAAFRSTWARLTDVLQVLPGAGYFEVLAEAAGESSWTEHPPEDAASQFAWANWWAAQRLAAKSDRNFIEADRIRGLLAGQGWEVRDNRDGTATVQRK